MINKVSKRVSYTQRDIADSLNNAVGRVLRPASLKMPDDERMGRLRRYAFYVLQPLLEHVSDGLLKPEELTAILTSAAFFVHLKMTMKTDKFPNAMDAATMITPTSERDVKKQLELIKKK